MLHKTLSEYLNHVETLVHHLDDVYVERYEEEILTFDRVNLRIRIRYTQGYLLELHEAVVLEQSQLKHLDYRYHLQNSSNQMIFRYDSAPHFPDLPNFPHHKHLPKNVISVKKPSIAEILQEVEILVA